MPLTTIIGLVWIAQLISAVIPEAFHCAALKWYPESATAETGVAGSGFFWESPGKTPYDVGVQTF